MARVREGGRREGDAWLQQDKGAGEQSSRTTPGHDDMSVRAFAYVGNAGVNLAMQAFFNLFRCKTIP
jgi:hypothetical protein